VAVEGRIPFRGWETWYRVVGEDTAGRLPLLCLHGGPGSTHHYFEPLERLAEAGRRVVVYDQLGCGASSRPEDPAVFSLALFLEELETLRAELGLERVHLLGTSWGGMLALEHVLAQPDGIAGLVLSSTPVDSRTWSREAARLRDELPTEVRDVLVAGVPGEAAYDEAERLSTGGTSTAPSRRIRRSSECAPRRVARRTRPCGGRTSGRRPARCATGT
jgi:proline-specific peptidase